MACDVSPVAMFWVASLRPGKLWVGTNFVPVLSPHHCTQFCQVSFIFGGWRAAYMHSALVGARDATASEKGRERKPPECDVVYNTTPN